MYERFYNLRRKPFEITPDPSFLFPTDRHKEALAALYYGIRRRKGFVVMTGEVGTGKTLLVRWLLQLLKGTNITYSYVFNPRLSPLEFLRFIVGDLGLPTSGKTKSDLLLDIGRYLVSRNQEKLATVLVVDEAHHLSADALEEVRLLTNLETADGKLLQILLIGQPELDDTLDLPQLRQLKQRIALRARLEPLDRKETSAYIERRLQIAGAARETTALFPEDSVSEIYRYSKGIPRLINTICENALISAYARQMRSVPVQIISEVVGDFRLNVSYRPQSEAPEKHDNKLWHQANEQVHFSAYQDETTSKSQSPDAIVEAKHEPYL